LSIRYLLNLNRAQDRKNRFAAKFQIDPDSGWVNVPQKLTREKKAPRQDDRCSETISRNGLLEGFKAAGIHDLRLHDLRQDFASRLINAGASLYQVQHQLAHSDPRITQRYAHLLPENQSVVDRIDGTWTTTILLQSKEKEPRQLP